LVECLREDLLKIARIFVLFLLIVGFGVSASAWAKTGSTILLSEGPAGQDATSNSSWPSMSADGRFVVFSSWASNLVPHDLNDAPDIFVRDLVTGATTLISVDSAGAQGNDSSFSPSISADGNVVAFRSDATNLIAGDTEGKIDVFVHTISTGVTQRVSQRPSGLGANRDSGEPAISGDGRIVAFSSDANNLVSVRINVTGICCDIFVHNVATGHNRLGDPMLDGRGASDSFAPVLSSTGRYLGFFSWGCDIVQGIPCLDESSVYRLDLRTNAMTLVTEAYKGGIGFGCGSNPAISADGTKVAFISDGNNLVPGDTNGAYDVFVRNLMTGVTTRVSVTSKGAQTNGGLGRVGISADGRFITFQSDAWNIVPNDANLVQDIFVHDMRTGRTTRVSVGSAGQEADAYSANAAVDADGDAIAFESDADNLVPPDENFTTDIFVHTPA
jgi:Tol biopolymer transport system component